MRFKICASNRIKDKVKKFVQIIFKTGLMVFISRKKWCDSFKIKIKKLVIKFFF